MSEWQSERLEDMKRLYVQRAFTGRGNGRAPGRGVEKAMTTPALNGFIPASPAMLRRLMEDPPPTSINSSCSAISGKSAYPASPTARQAALKHDRTHLKKRLKVNYIYLPESQQYILNDAGPYGRVSISPEMLHAFDASFTSIR